MTALVIEHDQVWAFTRRNPDGQLLVTANCSSRPASVHLRNGALPVGDGWTAVLATHAEGAVRTPADLELDPWESIVWRR
jgi:hypothetical protein